MLETDGWHFLSHGLGRVTPPLPWGHHSVLINRGCKAAEWGNILIFVIVGFLFWFAQFSVCVGAETQQPLPLSEHQSLPSVISQKWAVPTPSHHFVSFGKSPYLGPCRQNPLVHFQWTDHRAKNSGGVRWNRRPGILRFTSRISRTGSCQPK